MGSSDMHASAGVVPEGGGSARARSRPDPRHTNADGARPAPSDSSKPHKRGRTDADLVNDADDAGAASYKKNKRDLGQGDVDGPAVEGPRKLSSVAAAAPTSTTSRELSASASTDSDLSILPHYHDDPHAHHSAPFVDPTTNAPSPILPPVLQLPDTPSATYIKHALHTPAIIPGVTQPHATLCNLLKPLNEPPLVPHVRARRAAASYKRRKPQQHFPPAKPPFLPERSLVSAAALAVSATSSYRGTGNGVPMQGTPFPAFLQQVTPRTQVTAGLAQLNPVSARFIDRDWWTGSASAQSETAPPVDSHHEEHHNDSATTVAAAAAAAALIAAGASSSGSRHSESPHDVHGKSDEYSITPPSEWAPEPHSDHDLHHHGPHADTSSEGSGAAGQASMVDLPPATLAGLPSDSRDLLGILLLAANGSNKKRTAGKKDGFAPAAAETKNIVRATTNTETTDTALVVAVASVTSETSETDEMPPKRKTMTTTLEALAEVSPTASRYQLRSRGPALALDLDSVPKITQQKMKPQPPATVVVSWTVNGSSKEIEVAELKKRIADRDPTHQPIVRMSHNRNEWANDAAVLLDHVKHILAAAATPSPTIQQPRVVVDFLPDLKLFPFLPLELLEPQWDRHYTIEDARGSAERGGVSYTRPGGWMRFGLRVKGKYSDDKWLGPPGPRDTSDKDEWFVTYHGTAHQSATSIARQGYNTGTVWSSTSIADTGSYSCKGPYFPSKGKQGYAVVMQNRVSKKHAISQGGAIYTAPQRNIRPYAILISATPIYASNRYPYGYY
ncbi:hypothetical protein HDU87_005992 [Geranomyces variabilis]|uniref:Uncharacterized protein n=1 Tax=Geranomyces variabilis TaxID=109894 RepID=A0AAD5TQA0_9FUNG|nr:hypothetical protein HDU87_005992 [Geranomyces variabilis]